MSLQRRSRRSTAPTDALPRALAACRRAVRAVAFWLAIALPVVYGPALLAAAVAGVDPRPGLVLLAAHAVAVALGQGHTPS